MAHPTHSKERHPHQSETGFVQDLLAKGVPMAEALRLDAERIAKQKADKSVEAAEIAPAPIEEEADASEEEAA